MRLLAFLPLGTILLTGFQGGHADGDRTAGAQDRTTPNGQFTQVTVSVDRASPNVDISSYVLISADVEAHRREAEAIMQLRAKLPLAVQTKDAALFDRILAKSFIFRAADEFWNRADYIRNRVEELETVKSARYENLVLQLFGDVAVSTYRNVVQLTESGGKAATLHMSWASVYLKENGEWKIGAVHLIDKQVGR